jgi:hypothetical protein
MDKHENATITAETVTREQDAFEVREEPRSELDIAEFDSAPLTDINFGF